MSDLFDRDTERATLGAVIATGGACLPDLIATGLNRDHFTTDEHRRLWELLLGRHDAGDPINPALMSRVVSATREPQKFGGCSYVDNSVAYASRAPEHDARELLGLHILRGIQKHGQQCARAVETTVPDGKRYQFAQGILERVEVSVGDLDTTPGTSEESAEDMARLLLEDLDASLNAEDTPPPVSTGIGTLDDIFRDEDAREGSEAGLVGGDLGVVAARPGEGKTALAECIAINIARQNYGAAICSLDMGAKQLRGRLLAKLCHDVSQPGRGPSVKLLADRSLMTGLSQKRRDIARRAVSGLAELPLHITRIPRPGIREIRSYARRLAHKLQRNKTPLKLLVVDYLDKIRGDHREGDRRLQIGVLCNQLKDLAEELDCTVILLVQINRSAELNPGGKPEERNLKESGDIEQSADWIWLLWRQGKRDQTRAKDEITVIVAKNRRGEPGIERDLSWHGPTGTIADRPWRATHAGEVHKFQPAAELAAQRQHEEWTS